MALVATPRPQPSMEPGGYNFDLPFSAGTAQLWVWKERCQGNRRRKTKGSKTELIQRLQFLLSHIQMLHRQERG